MKLKNQTILITGGTSGIGRELLRQLWEAGNDLVVLGRSQRKLDALSEKFAAITVYQCDLSQRRQVEKTMEDISGRHPNISVLINNAAVQFTPTFTSDDFDFDSIKYEVTTNLLAPLWITSLALVGGLMRQKQAVVVNVSSGLAFYPKTESAVYCATKAALHSFSQSLRYQLETTPVRVAEAIMPLVDTPMTQGRGSGKMTPERAAQLIIKGVEAGRDEVYIGKARLLPWMTRIAPGLIKNMLKRS